jgi:hypothetical protein
MAFEFLCPITCELMTDPATAQCGHSFERKAIEQWLTENGPAADAGVAVSD